MRAIEFVGLMILAIALVGCGWSIRNDSEMDDYELPYPRGTCFQFTVTETQAISRTYDNDEYSFIVFVPVSKLTPVQCKTKPNYKDK